MLDTSSCLIQRIKRHLLAKNGWLNGWRGKMMVRLTAQQMWCDALGLPFHFLDASGTRLQGTARTFYVRQWIVQHGYYRR